MKDDIPFTILFLVLLSLALGGLLLARINKKPLEMKIERQNTNLTVGVDYHPIIWGTELLLWEAEDRYGLKRDLLYDLAFCESSLKHKGIWGDYGTSYGLFQWKLRSWADYNERYELELNILNLEDQINLTGMVLQDGGQHNWKNCWNRIVIN